jgi:hypothetical protein
MEADKDPIASPAAAVAPIEATPVAVVNTGITPGPGHLAVRGGLHPPGDTLIVPGGPLPKPLQRRVYQEAVVMRVIEELQLDPLQLPRPSRKHSIKATIKELVKERDPQTFAATDDDDVFDKTWKRLRKAPAAIGFAQKK